MNIEKVGPMIDDIVAKTDASPPFALFFHYRKEANGKKCITCGLSAISPAEMRTGLDAILIPVLAQPRVLGWALMAHTVQIDPREVDPEILQREIQSGLPLNPTRWRELGWSEERLQQLNPQLLLSFELQGEDSPLHFVRVADKWTPVESNVGVTFPWEGILAKSQILWHASGGDA